MGDKVSAKRAMIKAGVPVVPGSEGKFLTTMMQKKLLQKSGIQLLSKQLEVGW